MTGEGASTGISAGSVDGKSGTVSEAGVSETVSETEICGAASDTEVS